MTSVVTVYSAVGIQVTLRLLGDNKRVLSFIFFRHNCWSIDGMSLIGFKKV